MLSAADVVGLKLKPDVMEVVDVGVPKEDAVDTVPNGDIVVEEPNEKDAVVVEEAAPNEKVPGFLDSAEAGFSASTKLGEASAVDGFSSLLLVGFRSNSGVEADSVAVDEDADGALFSDCSRFRCFS